MSGGSVSESLIDTAVAVCFSAAALLSVYFNFFAKWPAKPINE